MKIIWFDCETTGLSPYKNDIVRLGYMLQVNRNIVTQGDIKMRPMCPGNIEPLALKVNGLTKEEIMEYPPAREGYMSLLAAMDPHIDKYDKEDKAAPGGYNVGFDLNFLSALKNRLKVKFGHWSYLTHYPVDPYAMTHCLASYGLLGGLKNRKLDTLCKRYGIEIDAHDAASDIRATRELWYAMMRQFNTQKIPA